MNYRAVIIAGLLVISGCGSASQTPAQPARQSEGTAQMTDMRMMDLMVQHEMNRQCFSTTAATPEAEK
jgi:hypothetical protein